MFGIVGYWLVKHDFEPAPMLLGFVLGPLMEENLRRAMLIARGDPSTFVTRPISGGLIGVAVVAADRRGAADDRAPSATRCSSKSDAADRSAIASGGLSPPVLGFASGGRGQSVRRCCRAGACRRRCADPAASYMAESP